MASDKPTINLNLDTLDREDAKEPFRFVLGGKQWIARDMYETDWQELVAVNADNPEQILKVFLGDKFNEFRAKRGVPMWKIDKLADAIRDHYGITDLSVGEGDASPQP